MKSTKSIENLKIVPGKFCLGLHVTLFYRMTFKNIYTPNFISTKNFENIYTENIENIYMTYILKKLRENGRRFWSVVGNVLVGDRSSHFGQYLSVCQFEKIWVIICQFEKILVNIGQYFLILENIGKLEVYGPRLDQLAALQACLTLSFVP